MVLLKTHFRPCQVIQPFYTGGKVSLDQTGRILVTTLDEDVLLTDFESGGELARIEGDDEQVTALARTFPVTSANGRIEGMLTKGLVTPDASFLAICSRSFSMRIYSLSPDYSTSPPTVTPVLQRSVKAHTAPVIIADTDPTGTLLATGGADGLVKVWDIKGGFVTHNLRGHGGVISAMKFYRPDSTARKGGKGKKNSGGSGWRLATGADDAAVRVWDLEESKCLAVLDSHVSVVRGLDWSRDGRTLVSGSRDQVVCIWDTKRWKLKGTIPVLEELEVVGFLAPGVLNAKVEGQVLYMGGRRNRVRLWDLAGGKEVTQIEDDEHDYGERGAEGIVDIIYHEALHALISVHNDQTILTHSLSLESPTSTSLPILRRLSGHHDEIIDLQYLTPTSSLLALATNSEDVRILSVNNSFSDVGVLRGHGDIVICLDRDWSGFWLATGSKDNEARLWHIDGGKSQFTCHARLTGHAESVGAIALPRSPRKGSAPERELPPKFLITGSQDRTIKMWHLGKKAKAVYTRKAHSKDINAIDVSPDDEVFVSASQDRTVKVWSMEGEVLGVLQGHKRGVWSVKFAPASVTAAVVGGAEGAKGGRMVVTGSGDKSVKLWSLTDYSCLKTFEGHTNSVLKAVWLTGGLQVASSGGDGLVKVWDVKSGECNATLDNHEDKIWALTVRNDDQVLVSGGGDSVVTFWEDITSETQETAAKAEEELIEQEQALQNHIHNSDYRSAIALALTLNHPGRLLNLFTAVSNTSPPQPGSMSGLLAVDEVLGSLSDEQLYILLCRVRDWNTNAKTAAVAQRVLHVIVKKYEPQRLIRLKGAAQVWDALKSYTERHYRRIEELVDESYLVEYTLREMEEVLPDEIRDDDDEMDGIIVGKEVLVV